MVQNEFSSSMPKPNNERLALVVMCVLYAVGIVGFVCLRDRGFLLLTPLNLLISLLVSLHFHSAKSTNFWLASLTVAVGGFLIEVVGVNTGLLFGRYHYGPVLGFSLFSTPLSIGVNWLLLVYCSASLINFLLPQNNSRVLKSTLAAVLMVALDAIIEPVAIATDMWRWETAQVPLQNYIGWFVSALLLQGVISRFVATERNLVAAVVFLLQVVFFAMLNLML